MIKYLIIYFVFIILLNLFFDQIFKKNLKANYYKGSKNKKKLLKLQKRKLKKKEKVHLWANIKKERK